MKKIILVFLLFTFRLTLISGQSWYWGEAGYNTGSFSGFPVQYIVTTDTKHNAYITGAFGDTIRFGSMLLNSSGVNVYLVKYDSAGNASWAVKSVDIGSSYCCSLFEVLDKFGNIFVTGTFHGTVIFGNDTLRGSPYYEDAFLVKYSVSGNLLWARQSVSEYACYGYSVGTDNSGNAYITGFFDGKDFFGSDSINNPHESFDVFLVKYDSAGNVLWAKQSTAPSAVSYGWAYSLAADTSGNVYVTGQFNDTISFDATTLLSPRTYATFITKYSPAGDVLWAKQNTNSTINSESWPFSIILSNTNNLYMTGFFVDAVRFGSQSLYSPSTNSAFLVKYDTGGNVVWAEQSSVGWYGGFLASDNLNHIYLTGETDNNPDTLKFGNYELYSSPNVSLASFIIQFDSSGKALCGSMLNDFYAQGIASDSSGRYIYTTGVFYDTLNFGTDTLFGNMADVDVFTCRWQHCPVDAGINTIVPDKFFTSVYPNPNNGEFNLICHSERSEESLPIMEVYNVLGEKVFTETLRSAQGNNLIDLRGQPSGIYLYRVISESGALIGDGKVVIEK